MTDAIGSGHDVILQAFHWNLVKTQGTGTVDGRPQSWYRQLAEAAPRIAAMGFTVVHLPPPWVDDSSWEHDGRHGGGEGYFWRDFELDSRYGTKAELASLGAQLHALHVRTMLELVTRHRDATRMQRDLWPYPGPCWKATHPRGRLEDGDFDLALTYPIVYDRLGSAMNELMTDCAADGWRFDRTWHEVEAPVVNWLRDTERDEYLSVGHPPIPSTATSFEDERAASLAWSREAGVAVTDEGLKRAIQHADARRLRQAWVATSSPTERARLVTFVDNHDTGASPFSPANGWGQKRMECPPGFKSRAYAFLLTMPGTPEVYWPDVFDWALGDDVAALLAARRRAHVTASSTWTDLSEDQAGLVLQVHDERDEPSLVLAIDSGYSGPGAGWAVSARKEGEWTVWTRAG